MARDRWNENKSGGGGGGRGGYGNERGYPEMSDNRSRYTQQSSYNERPDRRTNQFEGRSDRDRNDYRSDRNEYRSDRSDRTATPMSERGGRGGRTSQSPAPSYSSRGGGGGNFGNSGDDGDFYDKMDGVNRDIERIKQNLRELERLHNQLVNAVSSSEVNRYQGQIDEIQEESNRLLDRGKTTLKRLVASTKEIAKTDPNEARLRQNKQSNAAKKLLDVADEYQKLQQWSKQKYRQRMEREIRIAKPDATPQEIDRALEGNGGGGAFMQALMNDSKVQNARRQLRDMESRQDELARIERSIEELFTLFQDMQMMIETQQEVINTIEVQVEATTVNLTEASKEMTKAVEHKKSSRKTAWIICAIVTVIVLIVLAIVFWQVVLPLLKLGGGGGSSGSEGAAATGTALATKTISNTVGGPAPTGNPLAGGTLTTTTRPVATTLR